LPVLLAEEAYSDVIREAQEIVELASKGMLRQIGVEPPKWHDVGSLLIANKNRLPAMAGDQVEKVAQISAWLRKEREFSFYGDIDFIPTEHYSKVDAQRAIEDAEFTVRIAEQVIPEL
jgi:hypothetical protein